MKTEIWVVAAANGERGERPNPVALFVTEDEAEAHADREMRSEWEAYAPINEKGYSHPYPGDWRRAQEKLLGSISDGSWGQYEITCHEVDVPVPALDRIAARLRGEWYDPSGDLESDIAGVLREAEGAVDPAFAEVLQLLDDTSAALANVMARFGNDMKRADKPARDALVKKARALCDRLLRPETEEN